MSASRPDDYDDMPALQNVSDSDASDSDFDRDSDEDFMDDTDDTRPHIIVNPFASLPARSSRDNDHEGDEDMPGLEPIAPPTSSSTAPQPTTTPLAAPMPAFRFAASQSESVSRPRSGHRRARVESDDEGDTDRDRRHPFQRTGTGVGLGATAGTTTAQTGGHANDDYRRFFEAALGGSRMNNPANPTQGAWAAPTHPLFANIGRTTQPNAQDPGQPDRISISIDLGTVLTGPGHGVHVHRPTPPNQSAGPGVPGVGIGAAAGGTGRMPWMNMGPAPGTSDAAQGQNTPGTDGITEQGQPNPDEPISFGEFVARMISGRGLNFGPGIVAGGGGLEQLLNSLRGLPEREDPERARRLVDGLEDVPVGLIRRLERVAALGGSNGEETGAVGGDSGCAICWDRLLDPPGEGPEAPQQEEEQAEEESEAVSKDTVSNFVAAEPQASTSTAEESVANSSSPSESSKKKKPKHPRIVSLPCAHVFHAECLIPWFTRPRQTTCPTCRFNIDPENLTATPVRRSQRATTGNDANEQRNEADGANLGPDIATPPPPSGALPRWGLPESIPQDDLLDLGPENAPSGLQWIPLPFPSPGGGAGISILGVGMSSPIRTRSRSRQTAVRRSAQPYTTQSSSGPAGTPGDSSSSGSRDNPVSSSSSESSSAQAGPSTSNGTRDSSASSSTADMPSSSSGHFSSSSISDSESSSTSNLTTNAPAAPENRPDTSTNSEPAPNDIRGIAQAMLRMLGLQGIVDPSHVNVSGIPEQLGSGNATRATPASGAVQNPGNAAAAGHNDQQNGQGATRNAATNPTPDPGTNAGQPGHHQWSIGLDFVFGTGPPPSVIPAGMPPIPGGAQPGEDNEEFEEDIGDGMVMMDMDMMFGPEDGDHPPIPHFHHHHHHHHHHDHDEHGDDDEDDDHDHGVEGDLAAFQRMLHTVMSIPFPNTHPPPPSADAPATTAANPVNSTPQLPQNIGNRPGFVFPMPDIPAVQMTGGSVGDLLRAFAGPNRTQSIASRRQQGTSALSQLQTSTSGTPAVASTSNQPTPPPPTSGPSAFSDMRTRTAPSQSQPTSSLPGEINRLFGNVPPIRPAAAPSSGPERVHSPFVTAPWASVPTSSNSQTAPSMQATSAVSPGTPAPPSSQSNNAESSGSQSATEASRPEQQSQRRQQGRGHPTTQPAGADIDEGPLGRFLRSLSGLPLGPSNRAARPTGLGGGGLLSGDAVFPGLATRRATRATDGGQARQQRKWTPPPAPGLTLRQRIEKKEREHGLRCWDPSCGIGPSDEDPFVEVDEAARRQIRIRTNASSSQEDQSEHSGEIRYVCDHTFHPSCLVSAQRVALRGAEENVIGDSVEVSCPVCRSTGLISRADWEEGAQAL